MHFTALVGHMVKTESCFQEVLTTCGIDRTNKREGRIWCSAQTASGFNIVKKFKITD